MLLDDVAFRYRRGAPWVLRGLSLTLPPGRIIEVTGPNGAGKSTVLRLVAGLLRPRRGRIAQRPSRVGYAPERFPADQPFTGRAYLTHMARMRRLPAVSYERWAADLQVTPLLDIPLAELSKGGAHKIGLIQALMPDPDLLVLDEPFAGLDSATREALPSLLADRAAGGAIVVVSDHQRVLRDLPDIERVRLGDARATPAERTGYTVIEVAVPTDEAPAVLADLRAKGYEPRQSSRAAVPPDATGGSPGPGGA